MTPTKAALPAAVLAVLLPALGAGAPALALGGSAPVPALGGSAPASAQGVPGHPGERVRLAGSGACTYPSEKQFKARPWSLQRVLLDELWQGTDKGKGVRVAVIDTGVDDENPQLATAVDKAAGLDLLAGGKGGDPTNDEVGHGTKVAGIIAARPREGTGFVGLAPNATVIPVRQNDADSSGDSDSMARAIDHAVAKGADVINISQDTTKPLSATSALAEAVREAIARKVVVVASAGNDGLDGKARNTYPAAFDGVLAVASSDRNNERAAFSQAGSFVGVAAPGVDIVSTVPGGGQCTDSGTSFSAPFVAGVAALLKEKHPDWSTAQIVTRIEQTAERSVNGHDDFVGWGVVDPVRAVQESDVADPPSSPVPDPGATEARAPDVAPFSLAETPAERDERHATYALGITAVLITVIAGTAVALRDLRRRRGEDRGA
ncbi:type VII secretion-associated serine protease mycosin [Streptomyces capillispiralis]|uniref:Type VII secretion-associated serine protease mycosin n=1 Tax=Streptomyces capillispiralis TaxID=68182 RepID=A0A561TCN8_9ACTN|nr:type VII secretion-associated serine protease mycosin [Streptomyces capillispiralis]TWF84866.1 type VII secretion-associated serine protease mycosin [Streptomyces capillispiralis]GHH96367.1 type VII secretion-associated serine protease [Streptomyces capillispiralis]